jgi:hypothetical protein
MTSRSIILEDGAIAAAGRVDRSLLEALRREWRHAAVSYLSTDIALGIAFSLAIDMAIAAAARI